VDEVWKEQYLYLKVTQLSRLEGTGRWRDTHEFVSPNRQLKRRRSFV